MRQLAGVDGITGAAHLRAARAGTAAGVGAITAAAIRKVLPTGAFSGASTIAGAAIRVVFLPGRSPAPAPSLVRASESSLVIGISTTRIFTPAWGNSPLPVTPRSATSPRHPRTARPSSRGSGGMSWWTSQKRSPGRPQLSQSRARTTRPARPSATGHRTWRATGRLFSPAPAKPMGRAPSRRTPAWHSWPAASS